MSTALPDFVSQLILDGTKVGWYPERVRAWDAGEKIAPITMDVAWTRQCNAACTFCYAQLQASEAHTPISLQHAKDFLSDAASIGVKGVSLISDGESTVVPWYEESIEHGARVGLQLGVGTNGVRLKRRVLERILPHLSYLRFNFSAGELGRYKQIMGLKERDYHAVIQNVRDAMELKRKHGYPVTVNMQMVTMPEFHDQILPLAKLASEIGPDYLIYKHCADNVEGMLGVDYTKYDALAATFREAEAMTRPGFRVVVKWSRLEDEGKRTYQQCYGPPFVLQMSGNGLIAPCGFLFNEKYKKFHIGNITKDRFADIWASPRYWEVVRYLASPEFNAQQHCGPNCLQHNTNTWLDQWKKGKVTFPLTPMPAHSGFL